MLLSLLRTTWEMPGVTALVDIVVLNSYGPHSGMGLEVGIFPQGLFVLSSSFSSLGCSRSV